MKLRRRILSGYGLALVLMTVVILWAVLNLVALGRASDAILRENYQSILAARNMSDAVGRQHEAVVMLLLTGDAQARAAYSEAEAEFLYWLIRARDNITVPGEADILAALDSCYSDYVHAATELQSSPGGDSLTTLERCRDRLQPIRAEVTDLLDRLLQLNQDTMFDASSRAKGMADTAVWSTIFIAGAALGLALLFSLLLSRRLAGPIARMMKATEALAAGRYDVHVSERGSDELARLAAGFNGMAASLEEFQRMNVQQILSEKQKGEAVLRSITDGVLVVDASLRITNLNPRAARMLGIDPAASLNRHFLEVVHEERLFDLIRLTLETGRAPVDDEGYDSISRGEGASTRHYQFSITPVASGNMGPPGVVLLLRDITRLKELDRMKSDFVMTASHELCTPLHSLAMSIDLLLEDPGEGFGETRLRLLGAAREKLLRMKSLVGDLLDLSRMEAGSVRMDLERTAPGMIVDRALSAFSEAAARKGIVLSADLPDDLPEVFADPGKIFWVLSNLVGNALRYAGRSIVIAARRLGSWVHVSVSDDGCGIPEDMQSRIFDRFVQVDRDRAEGGSGLGLAICREIVRAHKGTIWVESAPGEGSRFTLTLPVADPEGGTAGEREIDPRRR